MSICDPSGEPNWADVTGGVCVLRARSDEEAAEIKEDSFTAERDIDNAKFKHRERSVKAARPLSMSQPKRPVT